MTDGPALLAAILADPKENTSRLVYADWLDESAGTVDCPSCVEILKADRGGLWPCRSCGAQSWEDRGCVSDGRQERAEFIRVQVELARLLIDGEVPQVNGEWTTIAKLRRRERELWQAGVDRSVHAPMCFLPGSVCTHIDSGDRAMPGWEFRVRRGFIWSAKCDWADWRTHAAAIVEAHPIERVKLTTPPGPPELASRYDRDRDRWHVSLTHGDRAAIVWVGWKLQQSILACLKDHWPGIEFELPPAGRFGVGGRRESMLIFDEYTG